MQLITAENIPGKSYKIIRLVKDSMIQSKNIDHDTLVRA